MVVRSKKTTEPAIPSMFFSPFKFKRGHCCKTKNDDTNVPIDQDSH